MNTRIIDEEEMDSLVDVAHNPPKSVSTNPDEVSDEFREEVAQLYHILKEQLSTLGEEGDFYGISDFSLAPNPLGPPSPRREFIVIALTESFFRSNFWEIIYQFLKETAPNYRVWFEQQVFQSWTITVVLTHELAQISSNNPKEVAKITAILQNLQ